MNEFEITNIMTFSTPQATASINIDKPWVEYYFEHYKNSTWKMSPPLISEIEESDLREINQNSLI